MPYIKEISENDWIPAIIRIHPFKKSKKDQFKNLTTFVDQNFF